MNKNQNQSNTNTAGGGSKYINLQQNIPASQSTSQTVTPLSLRKSAINNARQRQFQNKNVQQSNADTNINEQIQRSNKINSSRLDTQNTMQIGAPQMSLPQNQKNYIKMHLNNINHNEEQNVKGKIAKHKQVPQEIGQQQKSSNQIAPLYYQNQMVSMFNSKQRPQNQASKQKSNSISRDQLHNNSVNEANDSFHINTQHNQSVIVTQNQVSPLTVNRKLTNKPQMYHHQPRRSKTNIKLSPNNDKEIDSSFNFQNESLICENPNQSILPSQQVLLTVSNYYTSKDNLVQQNQTSFNQLSNIQTSLNVNQRFSGNKFGINLSKNKNEIHDQVGNDIYQLYQNTPTQNLLQKSSHPLGKSVNNSVNNSIMYDPNQSIMSIANEDENLEQQKRKIRLMRLNNKNLNQVISQKPAHKKQSSKERLNPVQLSNRISQITNPNYENGLAGAKSLGRFRTSKNVNQQRISQIQSQNSSIIVEDSNLQDNKFAKNHNRSFAEDDARHSKSFINISTYQNLNEQSQFSQMKFDQQNNQVLVKRSLRQKSNDLQPIQEQIETTNFQTQLPKSLNQNQQQQITPNQQQQADLQALSIKLKHQIQIQRENLQAKKSAREIYGQSKHQNGISPLMQIQQQRNSIKLADNKNSLYQSIQYETQPKVQQDNYGSILGLNIAKDHGEIQVQENVNLQNQQKVRYLKIRNNGESPEPFKLVINRDKQQSNNFHEYSNEFILKQSDKFKAFQQSFKSQIINSGQETPKKLDNQIIKSGNSDPKNSTPSQDQSFRGHSQIRINKKANYVYEKDSSHQKKDEDWLKKSADVLQSQRVQIGLNQELEKTQFINFKELQPEFSLASDQESNLESHRNMRQFTGFFVHPNQSPNQYPLIQLPDYTISQTHTIETSKNHTFEKLHEISDIMLDESPSSLNNIMNNQNSIEIEQQVKYQEIKLRQHIKQNNAINIDQQFQEFAHVDKQRLQNNQSTNQDTVIMFNNAQKEISFYQNQDQQANPYHNNDNQKMKRIQNNPHNFYINIQSINNQRPQASQSQRQKTPNNQSLNHQLSQSNSQQDSSSRASQIRILL
eukprot:403363154